MMNASGGAWSSLGDASGPPRRTWRSRLCCTITAVSLVTALLIGISFVTDDDSDEKHVQIVRMLEPPQLSFKDERIRYTGRFDLSGSAARFAWTGTQISCQVVGGGTLLASMTSGRKKVDRFNIFVNNTFHSSVLLYRSRKAQTIKVADLPADGVHKVTLWKATEDLKMKGSEGVLSFHGLTLEGDGSFASAPAPLPRRLEFIGDSDTAGWCNLGKPGILSWFVEGAKYEDSSKTWAADLANRFNAEMMIEAVSGYGVTRQSTPIQPYLNFTDGFGRSVAWNSRAWVPDAVIVLIGPNDYPPGGSISDEDFISAYTSVMLNVAERYADAHSIPPIIHVCAGSINGLDPRKNIEKASIAWNQKEQRLSRFKSHFISIEKPLWDKINAWWGNSEYNGCMMHYNPKGHAMVADAVEPQIRKIMGWADKSLSPIFQ